MHEFKNSSSIKSCHHDDKENCLTIKFQSGQTYRYPDCGKEDYEGLIGAESPGSHFHKKFKLRKYEKVE